jgi:type III pantothenate kinase
VKTTAKLPNVELIKPEKIVASSTVKGVQSGLYNGFLGLTEHIISKIKIEASIPDAHIVATGGLAELFVNGSKLFDVIDRRLSLSGLNIIYGKNK